MLREARVIARLEHPGIVPVHDAGTLPDGRMFYAMKRVDGRRLDEIAAGSPLPERLRDVPEASARRSPLRTRTASCTGT